MSDSPAEPDRETTAKPKKSRLGLFFAYLPLMVFAALAAVFFYQLESGNNASDIPSVLIGTKAPSLDLAPLEGLMANGSQVPALTDTAVSGKLALINVFASWCVPCRQEHPLLMDLASDERVTLVGINYKDKNENALRFLGELGNPYDAVGIDPKGQSSIDWGVYGIPETYLVDRDGTILFKQIGPFTPEIIKAKLMPLITKYATAGTN